MDPIIGGSLISGGLDALGSVFGGKSQSDALADSLAFQKRVYRDQQAALAPYRAAGTSALSSLQGLLASPESIKNDPAYQFRLAQGEQAANRALAARGGLLGGAALKSLTRYGQGMASDEFSNQFNRLASLAGIGQGAAAQTSAQAGQFGQSIGGQMQDFGNIRAAQGLGTAGAINNALNQYMNYNLAQQALNSPGVSGYGVEYGDYVYGPSSYGSGMAVG